jgi:hypothetical protein
MVEAATPSELGVSTFEPPAKYGTNKKELTTVPNKREIYLNLLRESARK